MFVAPATLLFLAIGLVAAAPTVVGPVGGFAMGRPDGTVSAVAIPLSPEAITLDNATFA